MPLFSSRLATLRRTLCLLLFLTTITGCADSNSSNPFGSNPSNEQALSKSAQATIAVLETTDLHANALSYDYFKLADDPAYGFERTATLIQAARKEFANTVLLDNGDTIQGTALADYEAQVNPISCSQQLSIYRAMATLTYDAGTLGNHEFNYGLPFLNQVLGGGLDVDGVDSQQKCVGNGFPVVLANVISTKTNKPLLQPYTILQRTISATDEAGKAVSLPIKIGIIGFTTPGILNWDKRYLDGKLRVEGAVESAERYLPEMRAQGADIIVALLHGGLDGSPYSPTMESPGLYLSKVPGIDAMLMGHQHGEFPVRNGSAGYNQPGVNNLSGTINGVPAVMASFWGKALGVVKLQMSWDGKNWALKKEASTSELRYIQDGKASYVAIDPAIRAAIEPQHQATLQYVKTPIGSTDFRMSTMFADVGDPGAIQIVNAAQQAYVADYIQTNLPQYLGLPVLSVSAPFKSGFQGGADYTDIPAGNLSIASAADLYLYPNTVYAVKVSGAEVKAWLEAAAQRFNRIDPSQTTPQSLISNFAGYNFDMFTTPDIQYEIDVTQPLKQRIKNLRYRNLPLNPNQQFIIATNNYRATSGKSFIPVLDGSTTIWASPDTNRDVVINYIRNHPLITRTQYGAARSWRFSPVTTAGDITFSSAANALPVAQAAGLNNISLLNADDGSGKGLARYKLDLSR
ncbi:bifunctional 2',3'-cyclic-nucleotide 2'-phosphodiesterase/3'-nucleotidase [Neisseriaceae bacterium TC5R-5]|nr:bifunctional 2',3'-cyclic-nucleotide 2'-phosphodiesterase/3'-nucleotidase [Neisseriaceae bacterium TC5R-5]